VRETGLTGKHLILQTVMAFRFYKS